MNNEYENRDEFTKIADHMESNPDLYGHDTELQKRIIADLRGLEYDDFANEKYATPKMQMIADFRALGRNDIAQRVMNGDFDQ